MTKSARDRSMALTAHRQTPHFLNYWNLMQQLGDKVEGRAQLYTQID